MPLVQNVRATASNLVQTPARWDDGLGSREELVK